MVRMTRFTNSNGRVDDGGSSRQVASCANADGDRDPGRLVGLVGRCGRPLPERHNNAAIRDGQAGSAARPWVKRPTSASGGGRVIPAVRIDTAVGG